MAVRRACAALLALGCVAAAAEPRTSRRLAQAALPAASSGDDDLRVESFFFGGTLDVSYACLVLTDLDDGGSDTLRTALADPRCISVKLAAGLTVALTRGPLELTRSVRLECDYAASALVPIVPRTPRSWDTFGGVNRAGAPLASPAGRMLNLTLNATHTGALTDSCVLFGGSTTNLLVIPASAPAGLRVNITNWVFRRGQSATSGGAISALSKNALLVIDHVTFDSNAASDNGGAIYVTSASALIVLSCLFKFNTALKVGAAIAAFNAELALERSWFEANVANSDGGTVATRNTDLQIHYTLFLENLGTALSVGPQATADQPALIAFSEFTRNKADGIVAGQAMDGGAIRAYGDRASGGPRLTLSLQYTTFTSNTATRFGGAIATSGGVTTLAHGCDFNANTDSCPGSPLGGALYLNVGADTGAGCSDVLTVNGDHDPCSEWRQDELVHQSTGATAFGLGITAAATCVPLSPALLGPFCCAPSLAAPLGCPWPPVVFDLPQLLCPAP